MNTTVIYSGKTHTTGGRDGASRTDDGHLDVKLVPPGSRREGTNPEQLFAAGWSACFLGAIGKAARDLKIAVADAVVDAEVDLIAGPDGYYLGARLNVSLPGVDPEVARAILDTAHQTCPYSKATRGNIEVSLNLISD